MIPIVYSRRYNVTAFGLERLHPFDGRKYGRIRDWLIRQGLRRSRDFVAASPLSRKQLLRVHTIDYLRSLRDRRVLARILEVPQIARLPAWLTRWRVLRPMRWAAGGTLLACRLALERGVAINLGGGFHHASTDRGGGFCVYSDAPLALALLHDKGSLGTALIVDTDAHQGNGTAEVIQAWPWAHLLDFYEEDIYPWPKVQEESAVPMGPGTSDGEYLEALRDHLPGVLNRVRPSLVIYNAGSDVLASDPLTRLALTVEGMVDRDLYLVTAARKRGVPVAMLLSGGYGSRSWEAHARSIEAILTRFDREI